MGEREGDFGESGKSVVLAGVFLSFCWIEVGEGFAVGNLFLVLILGLAF